MMTILTFFLVNLEKVGNPRTLRNELFSGHVNHNLIIKISFWNGGFPGKESVCNAGDSGSIPGSGRSSGEGVGYSLPYSEASLVAQLVKNPPAVWKTWVQSLAWEYPLEKGTATHSNILAWRIPWTIQSIYIQYIQTICYIVHRLYSLCNHGVAKSQTPLSNFHFPFLEWKGEGKKIPFPEHLPATCQALS